MSQRVKGQKEGIRAVAEAVRLSRAGLQAQSRPVSFLYSAFLLVDLTDLVITLCPSPDRIIPIPRPNWRRVRHALFSLFPFSHPKS